MTKPEVKEWLERLPEDADVCVSEGGLALVANNGACLELGGVPLVTDEEGYEYPDPAYPDV
jgi:hypothetical protein